MNKDMTESIDWQTALAYSEREATEKFAWWCEHHGVVRAYANVTIREQALIPLAVRVSIRDRFTHVNAPTVTPVNSVIGWLDANPYQVVTTRELGDTLGVTQAVARRLIRDLPHYFKRINQYKYEVRNYREERQLDKSQQ